MSTVKARRKPVAAVAAPERAAAYTLEAQVGFLLRCAHQQATEVFNAVMGRFSVTPTQFAALAKLDDMGSVSQNQLGRLTRMDPATISGVVGRLIARGYVRQSTDLKDARLVVLTLTACRPVRHRRHEAGRRRGVAADAGAAHRRRGRRAASRRSPRSADSMFAAPVIQHLTGDRLHLSHGPIDVVLKAWGRPAAVRASLRGGVRALSRASCRSCATSLAMLRTPMQEQPARRQARWRGAWSRPAAPSPTCS